jgi:hypothetical protein
VTGLKIGTDDIAKAYFGDMPIDKVYIGTDVIWSAAPSIPTPVSYFDWHEGSGHTTASIVPGGYTLSVPDFTVHQGSGAIGPNAITSQFTIAIKLTLTASGPGALRVLFTDGSYYGMITAGRLVGMYNDYPAGAACPLDATSIATMAFDGTNYTTYIDGVSAGSKPQVANINPGNTMNISLDSHMDPPEGIIDTFRYWDVVLTPTQVAALT